jgi:hypothetical protein
MLGTAGAEQSFAPVWMFTAPLRELLEFMAEESPTEATEQS